MKKIIIKICCYKLYFKNSKKDPRENQIPLDDNGHFYVGLMMKAKVQKSKIILNKNLYLKISMDPNIFMMKDLKKSKKC